jgi:transcriptional regulator with XRE-family HTH domain
MTTVDKEKRARFRALKTLPNLITGKDPAVKQRDDTLPAVVQKLKAWRKTNKLSQRQAVEVMASHDFPVLVETLQRWEIGFRKPGRLISKVLEAFLRDHQIIAAPPVYGRWKRPVSEEAVEEIRKLREGGMPLLTIAQRFGISDSAVSRICSKNRRAK